MVIEQIQAFSVNGPNHIVSWSRPVVKAKHTIASEARVSPDRKEGSTRTVRQKRREGRGGSHWVRTGGGDTSDTSQQMGTQPRFDFWNTGNEHIEVGDRRTMKKNEE